MARPTKINPIVVKKLEEAFSLGCTDEEACIYADICKQTLYNLQDKNQEFLDRKELLKNKPVLEARKAVISSFKSNPNIAFKYLEKRKADEFRLGVDVNRFTPDSAQLEKSRELIRQFIEDFRHEKVVN